MVKAMLTKSPAVLIALLFFIVPMIARAANAIDTSKLIDLTYTFDTSTIYWPTEPTFRHEMERSGITAQHYFYSSATYAAPEHGGTHLDAPIHFNEKGLTADQIPLANFIGPAAVIDFSSRAAKDRNATLSVDDISKYESANGTIPERAIVLARSGWGRYWPDRKLYLGSDKPGDVSNLRFPGFSPDAAKFLLRNRSVVAIAIDTASIDSGAARDFPVHLIWLGANKPAFENIANAEKLPPKGAVLFCMPMKIGQGTGGPARVFALLP
ncbi:MAG: cyclase family protein [Candidatus Binataceae bacterium]